MSILRPDAPFEINNKSLKILIDKALLAAKRVVVEQNVMKGTPSKI